MLMLWQDMQRLVQEAKMVPIVEPEVLMDGVHNIENALQQLQMS